MSNIHIIKSLEDSLHFYPCWTKNRTNRSNKGKQTSNNEQSRQNSSYTLIFWWFAWSQWPIIYMSPAKRISKQKIYTHIYIYIYIFIVDQNDCKLSCVSHHHVNVVIQWHKNIIMTVCLNSMDITYKFFT